MEKIRSKIKVLCARLKHTCENLTVHGPSFLARNDVHFIYKLFYFVIYIAVWIFSVTLIYKYLSTYREDTIRFTTRNDYLNWNTTFPSITVCETPNIGRLSAKIPDFIQNNLTMATFAKEVVFFNGQCTSCSSVCENGECNNNSALMNSVLRSECKELFNGCTWNNKPMNCCQHFQQIQTEYGKCYTMNNNNIYQENKDSYYVANSTSRKLGGLQLKVAQEVEIFLHSPNDIPYWNIEHDRRVVVSPTSQATILFSIVDIINDPEVSLIEPDERQCRFPDELPDNYIGYKLYSYSVCIIHCRIEAQIELCNCTSHLSPQVYQDRFCDLEGLKCLTKNYEKLKNLKVPGLNESALSCDCLSSCVESDYHIVSRRVTEGKGSVGAVQYILSNRPYERVTRQVAKTTLDLVVAVGSCFGLFFGGSLLSIVEFFYFICFKQWKFTKV